MQTHLLKLEPPYKFVFDEEHGRVGKVIAVLLRPSDEEKNFDNDRTISVPIVDLAYTWDDTDLAQCRILCDEFNPRISFDTYICCLMSVKKDKWLPNGFFSVFYFSSQLNELGIEVQFPGEEEKEGELTIETKLHLGNKEGKWWVENFFGYFYFGGSYESRERLRYGILERRNDYYRSFPQKRFTINLSTDNAEFQDMLDDINNTPYNSYE
ncbi:MAG: hypothetical protein IJ897_00825 [Prevotella sp.]|nr:hypothetical protein [Prevotella sp.]